MRNDMNIRAPETPIGREPPSADILIDRAKQLAPVLKERAARCEELRRVPEETVADFVDLGLIRATQPYRYGGSETDWAAMCEVTRVLAAACGSQAWIQRIMSDHAQMASTFPAEAQEDIWGADRDALISASFDPVGRATPVEGGFLFSGRHAFSSGVDHASWMICGGSILEDGRKDGPHFFLVPRKDAVIIDDWRTMGLSGTGSKSFQVDEAFVPAHRFLDGRLAQTGAGPGTAVNTGMLYRIPRGTGITTSGFAALTLGMAEGVLDEWLTLTATRTSRGALVAAQQTTQEIAARASGQIEAAAALYFTSLKKLLGQIERGETIGAADRANAKRNVCLSAKLCLEAGTTLFNTAGGRALMVQNHLQRQYRNLLASASHHALVWEDSAVECGALLLERYGADLPARKKH
jgi:3-hydroxy-9,10-secoandrosta-1,3,5(10)-triene-9,17-dione monooxygenase